ncbi:MAG TPA: TonB family protein [Chitinophagaceae bacterium]|nr:TonB family protein [Chitinophagaceae bacterium]
MRIIFSILFFYGLYPAFSQKSNNVTDTYYAFDTNWKPSSLENATYLSLVRKSNDTTYRWYNYNIDGPLFSVETYEDDSYSILNGFVAYYDKDGMIDSSGYVKKGKRDKTWYFYTDTLSIIFQKDYEDGKLIRTIDLESKRKEDSSNEKIPEGFEEVEKEADFKGGVKSWVKYLEKNLQFPKRAENLRKSGQVMIGFAVDTDGSTKELFIVKSVELSLDMEAWRLIEISPKWDPAVQKGKNVKAYRRQPITFAFSD